MLSKLSYNFFAWRKNPEKLANRIINGNLPNKFTGPKNLASEVLLFVIRFGLRPLTLKSMRKAYADTAYRPLSFGYFCTVFMQDNQVVKIYEFTTRCSPKELQKVLQTVQESHNILCEYLGDFITPTTVNIEKHPILKKDCIVLRQPFVSGKPLFGKSYVSQLNKLEREQFKLFLSKNEKMMLETGWTADINGHNLFATGKSVILVDTIPSGQVVAKYRRTTLSILEREHQLLEKLR